MAGPIRYVRSYVDRHVHFFLRPRKTATHKALFQGHSGNFSLTSVIHLNPRAFLNNLRFLEFWWDGGVHFEE